MGLRVGVAVRAEVHPDSADGRLLLLDVDVADSSGALLRIVSALGTSYGAAALRGAALVVATNLAPFVLRGMVSYGGVLCAYERQDGDADGDSKRRGGKKKGRSKPKSSGRIEVVLPPAGAMRGQRVQVAGEPLDAALPSRALSRGCVDTSASNSPWSMLIAHLTTTIVGEEGDMAGPAVTLCGRQLVLETNAGDGVGDQGVHALRVASLRNALFR